MPRLTDALNDVVQEAIAEQACPGAVCAIVKAHAVTYQAAWGIADPENETPMAENTIFDAASVTKPVSTATSICILLERGKFCLEQRLNRWFPEAKQYSEVTLRHLITHTAGLYAWKTYYERGCGSEEILRMVLETPLERRPGMGYTYSDLGYILLAAVVEKVTGQPINEFARENIFEPLGMVDTGYLPPSANLKRFAVTGHCSIREGKTLRGEVHDGNAYAMGGVAGHAGLFTTVHDLAIYARMILNDGQLGSERILSPATVREMAINQIDSAIGAHTFGWFAYPNGYLPRADLLSRQSFGHTGFTGTALIFDPALKCAFILLTNRVFTDPENNQFLAYRKRILNVMAAIASEE